MLFYCFSNVPVSHLIPKRVSMEPKISIPTCHELCNKEECLAVAKRIQSIEQKILNKPEEKQRENYDEEKPTDGSTNKERSTQTLLKAMDCKITCPVLREVGVKTDCYKLTFSSYESESSSTSKSSGSMARRCDEIVKRVCAKSDTEEDVLDTDRTRDSKNETKSKFATIKSVLHLEGPDIECNLSQCVHSRAKE